VSGLAGATPAGNAASRDEDPTSCTRTRPTITGAADAPACVAESSRASPGVAVRPAKSSGTTKWVIKRSFAWFNKFRRLTIRYERRLDTHHAFTSLARSLICLRALAGRL
jgi:hypothetical protein